MSGPEDSERGASEQPPATSVLSNLPRARPQRSSPRRAAARRAGSANGGRPEGAAKLDSSDGAKAAPKAPAGASKPRQRKAGKPRSSSAGSAPRAARRRTARSAARRTPAGSPEREPVPRQGFASEGDTGVGVVQPPGGAELFASAVEIVGELTKSGVATGERLVKDLFSRLSPS